MHDQFLEVRACQDAMTSQDAHAWVASTKPRAGRVASHGWAFLPKICADDQKSCASRCQADLEKPRSWRRAFSKRGAISRPHPSHACPLKVNKSKWSPCAGAGPGRRPYSTATAMHSSLFMYRTGLTWDRSRARSRYHPLELEEPPAPPWAASDDHKSDNHVIDQIGSCRHCQGIRMPIMMGAASEASTEQ
eukprot:jgi/Mesvir1/298/Mv25428-RA.1